MVIVATRNGGGGGGGWEGVKERDKFSKLLVNHIMLTAKLHKIVQCAKFGGLIGLQLVGLPVGKRSK